MMCSFLHSRKIQEVHITECWYSSYKMVLLFSQKAINQVRRWLEYEEA